MKRCLLISFFLTLLVQIYCQKQGNIWYFGQDSIDPNKGGAGLDFGSGTPIPILNSAMPQTLACATYCNSSGDLLFYSNGFTVYDRSHHVMENGDSLGGTIVAQQSVLIVPFPNDSNMFYLFSNDDDLQGNGTGLHYSIINMSLNNGLGAVIIPKAVSLFGRNAGQLLGCNHSNGIDFWVIVASHDSAKINTFLITKNGIQKHVTTYLNLGIIIPYINFEISPNGNKLALKGQSLLDHLTFRYIIEFEANTGLFSNPFPIVEDPEKTSAYNTGCCFSSDGNLFYDFERVHNNPNVAFQLYQYDLNAPDIKSSRILISETKYHVFDMQIGPDGKIYYSEDDYSYLNQIEYPNVRGLNCNLHKNYIYLGGKKASGILPNELLYSKKPTATKSVSKNKPLEIEFNYNSKQLIVHSPNNKKYEIQIFNIQGQSILNKEVSDNSQVNAASFPIGLYLYSIESEKKLLQTGKVLIY